MIGKANEKQKRSDGGKKVKPAASFFAAKAAFGRQERIVREKGRRKGEL